LIFNLLLGVIQITIGYTFINNKYWGRGHNRELKQLMLEYVFQFVETVFFEIGEKNWRSRKAIEKLGARLLTSQLLDEKLHVIYKIQSNDR
jgi:RimJ/RimL family protein N-acetyltransferase